MGRQKPSAALLIINLKLEFVYICCHKTIRQSITSSSQTHSTALNAECITAKIAPDII